MSSKVQAIKQSDIVITNVSTINVKFHDSEILPVFFLAPRFEGRGQIDRLSA